MRVIAIVLIILGILALSYGGFTYITQGKVADVGPVQVTRERERTGWIPPVLGASAIVAGAAMLLLGSRRSGPTV
jgi:hypothetical protein